MGSLHVRAGSALAFSVLLAGLAPSDARACGGCFNPPTGMPAPVTGHRMAIAMSPAGTTLWDQIQYAGEPDDAWRLGRAKHLAGRKD